MAAENPALSDQAKRDEPHCNRCGYTNPGLMVGFRCPWKDCLGYVVDGPTEELRFATALAPGEFYKRKGRWWAMSRDGVGPSRFDDRWSARLFAESHAASEVERFRSAAYGVSSAGGVYCKLCDSPAWNRAADVIHDADCPMPPPEYPRGSDEESNHG
jgi:hypothetical protein